jgi:6-phosphofructokinase 1
MRRIGVLTSGGDAPGMNAAIRAVVRAALARGTEVVGVQLGYSGLMDGKFRDLDSRTVGGIIRRGGTILGTARAPSFATDEGISRALKATEEASIEGLVVLGGDGSLRGALDLSERGLPTVGVPCSIDNDIDGTEFAIGVDTALNTAIEAIDRIKDTASSHQRAFVVEVMGRECGYLAVMSGLAAGAEAVLVPEVEVLPERLLGYLEDAYGLEKPHFIAVVAEGAKWKAREIVDYLMLARAEHGLQVRLTVLGHIQRGGPPLAYDRILASRMGSAAVEWLLAGETGVMAGANGWLVTKVGIADAVARKRPIERSVLDLARILAR